MRNTVISFLLICCAEFLPAQDVVQFRISKPYCVFNFLETATRQPGTSSTFYNYILSNTGGDSGFRKLCDDFKGLRLNYQYMREEFPGNRRQYCSTKDLLDIALVNADSFTEFKNRTIGILPNTEQQKLIGILQQAEIYYDRLIWNSNEQKIIDQKKALSAYVQDASRIFNKLHTFYRSGWSPDIPFVVALYPIPGRSGNSTATPHANSLCVGVLADETDHVERICVVLHEICHVLYDEQPAETQHELEKWFESSSSPFKTFAHNFIDEGLATALGNGWSYQSITSKKDTTAWYNNEYINGYAKELYPLVEQYLGAQRPVDKAFVDKAIELFAAKFPSALYDYAVLINSVSVYADAANAAERGEIWNSLGGSFQLSNTNLLTPIIDKGTFEEIKNSSGTQLVIIDRNHTKNLEALRKIFPQLDKISKGSLAASTIFSFYDDRKRPILILYSLHKEDTELLVKKMKAMKYFKPGTLVQ